MAWEWKVSRTVCGRIENQKPGLIARPGSFLVVISVGFHQFAQQQP
jgi:hypothetical protein